MPCHVSLAENLPSFCRRKRLRSVLYIQWSDSLSKAACLSKGIITLDKVPRPGVHWAETPPRRSICYISRLSTFLSFDYISCYLLRFPLPQLLHLDSRCIFIPFISLRSCSGSTLFLPLPKTILALQTGHVHSAAARTVVSVVWDQLSVGPATARLHVTRNPNVILAGG